MTWQETISFLTGCMPRPVARALMQQQEGSVREIRVRAGGKVRILTAGGEITCACTPTQPQVEQMAEALCCLLAGTAAGSWLRDRRLRRLRTLRARLDVVASLRLMLEQERMGLTELLCQCAHYAPTGPGGEQVSRRLLWVAHALVQEPLLSLGDAYAQACAQIPIPWEKAEEREAMRALFLQLGSGTAAMRAQAAAACLRRLRPLEEDARREAEKGGGLVMRLGLLLGLMAGIALW